MFEKKDFEKITGVKVGGAASIFGEMQISV